MRPAACVGRGGMSRRVRECAWFCGAVRGGVSGAHVCDQLCVVRDGMNGARGSTLGYVILCGLEFSHMREGGLMRPSFDERADYSDF